MILDSGDTIDAVACVLACGTKHRTLGLPNEEQFIGKGIQFCATCDGPLYKDRPVIVVGGGNSAVTEAIELAHMCSTVFVLQDLPQLTAEKALVQELTSMDNVLIFTGCKVEGYAIKDGKLIGVNIHGPEGNSQIVYADAVFLAVGLIPQARQIVSSLYSE